MNQKLFINEIAASLALIALLVLLLNPFNFWMPNEVLMMIIAGLVAVFALFASFVWREHARDEREGLHRMLAGRAAFLAGSAVLVIGIIVQSWNHAVDPWLVTALGVMILAKIGARIYGEKRQ